MSNEKMWNSYIIELISEQINSIDREEKLDLALSTIQMKMRDCAQSNENCISCQYKLICKNLYKWLEACQKYPEQDAFDE